MKKIWNEDSIREELAKLDSITGLSGAKLPIKFTNGRYYLACYHGDGEGRFSFSKRYFMDPEWAVEEALNTIRHEYAHYMDHVIYGNFGHGETWKICCAKVGASPIRCYKPWRNDYYNTKRVERETILIQMQAYQAGDCIIHPIYGEGRIKTITGEGVRQAVQVIFPTAGLKTLGLSWVSNNCQKK